MAANRAAVERGTGMKHRRTKILWGALAALFLIATVASAAVSQRLDAHSVILQESGIHHGYQNSVLAEDPSRELFFAGTYNNVLLAYRGAEVAWQFDARGSFVRLIPRPEQGLLFAGNTDNHVYKLDIDTGELLGDINVQRRIFDIDVTSDAGLVLISAGVSTAKHNIMLYTAEGEQLYNQQFRTQYKGVAFSGDDQYMLLTNNRGEIQKLDLEGNEVNKILTNYEQVMMQPAGEDLHVTLGTDGSYTIFDDELNVVRKGKPSIEAGDVPTAVGASKDGAQVFVGTKELYLYAMDESDQQVYSARLANSPSFFLPAEDGVYATGLGDFIYKIDPLALSGNASMKDLAAALSASVKYLAIAFAFCLAMFVPVSNRFLHRFARAIVKHRVAYALLIPTFALLILFNYAPTYLAFTRAFTNWSKNFFQASQLRFVGLDNFKLLWTEGYFLRGLKNLGIILLMNFVKVLTVPLVLAWLVSSMRSNRKKYIYRFLLVLPIVVPGVVSALMWKQMYDPTIGLFNQLLGRLGLSQLQHVWLGEEGTALGAIIFMGFPFVNAMAFLVYYGGYTSIDTAIFESARMDGAGRGRIFFGIQIPMISSQIKLMLTLTFISSIQEFYPIYLLTGGGPGTSTYVPALELYLNATTFGRYGYACALGIVMFLFIMVGTIVNLRIQNSGERG